MRKNTCRLCNSGCLVSVLTLKNMPSSIQRLLTRAQLASDKSVDLIVYSCQECRFVQISDMLAPDYYDEYFMTVSHSPQMREYQREQARAFVHRFGLKGRRVLEIGCGDGNFLQYMEEAGANGHGLEPSASFRKAAVVRGLKVLDGYVTRGEPIAGAPYDAFVTRQVLEHIGDPNGFLQGVRQALSPGGIGLIEVPSLEQALDGGRFYDFFPDHLNYFSATTLRHLLCRNGFEIVDLERGMNGEYLVATVRMEPLPDFSRVQESLDRISHEVRSFLQDQRRRERRVAVWGAGGKGITVLGVSDIRDIAYVVDSDPHKRGRLTPVTHLEIVGPEHLQDSPVEAIIITALAYRDEILEELQVKWGFRGCIAVIEDRLRIVRDA